MKRDLTEEKKIGKRSRYVELFDLNASSKSEVIRIILDTRKFEIELYWKRTAFFWTLIAAAIAGYCLLLSKGSEFPIVTKIQFAIANLGLIFSVGWYFANRGSKYWQLNWEKHLDTLEDDVLGPLFKTTISRDHYGTKTQFFKFLAPFPFSVTKINQVLNLVIISFWILVIADFVCYNVEFNPHRLENWISFYTISSVGTIIALWSLIAFSQTGIDNAAIDNTPKRKTAVNFDVRALEETE